MNENNVLYGTAIMMLLGLASPPPLQVVPLLPPWNQYAYGGMSEKFPGKILLHLQGDKGILEKSIHLSIHFCKHVKTKVKEGRTCNVNICM